MPTTCHQVKERKEIAHQKKVCQGQGQNSNTQEDVEFIITDDNNCEDLELTLKGHQGDNGNDTAKQGSQQEDNLEEDEDDQVKQQDVRYV